MIGIISDAFWKLPTKQVRRHFLYFVLIYFEQLTAYIFDNQFPGVVSFVGRFFIRNRGVGHALIDFKFDAIMEITIYELVEVKKTS